ncbi:hypothetical protein SCP_0702300 [Sparassis crispa]|uniref:Uncharacterized protein n=1 Tax=Sparassis crispa TaxID=139825 RepID=A0A401GTH6_9APHY|nr:hypothetical protein SCP_0702300 [Sparassis crispa]GBE85044.1 hypothetical protein SCP_0702300 [Sparassis crispa]
MPAVNSLTGGAQRAVQCGSCNDVPCLGEFAFTRRSSRGTEEDAVQFAPYEWNVRARRKFVTANLNDATACRSALFRTRPSSCRCAFQRSDWLHAGEPPLCIAAIASAVRFYEFLHGQETVHAARRRTPPGMRRRRRARKYGYEAKRTPWIRMRGDRWPIPDDGAGGIGAGTGTRRGIKVVGLGCRAPASPRVCSPAASFRLPYPSTRGLLGARACRSSMSKSADCYEEALDGAGPRFRRETPALGRTRPERHR